MLSTALQPKWIAMLVVALLMATVFVVMSAWQFGESRTETVTDHEITETPVPLTEAFQPERAMTGLDADQMVTLSGRYLDDTEVFVSGRIQGDETGYWVAGAFAVDGAPDDEIIPMVRGWVADPDDAGELPEGELEIEGRLLPTEAPLSEARTERLVFPTLSVAELMNYWDEPSYSGFVVAFDMTADGQDVLTPEDTGLQEVWVDPQPETSDINWLNLFYAVEWVVFAGFAFYLWWRLVKDAHERNLEEAELDRRWEEQWQREQVAKLRERRAGEESGVAGEDPGREPAQVQDQEDR
ncbi:SURF1 family protein [Nesterenkonia marinintestina]|uniref:SURF1 family protein n=1 Tax=Nesterenkonia marinintestina TaxID=2979865 RepID=UPI0021C1F162|nr:SURF1 family protein [Nesterenkonia sp. GX14115]